MHILLSQTYTETDRHTDTRNLVGKEQGRSFPWNSFSLTLTTPEHTKRNYVKQKYKERKNFNKQHKIHYILFARKRTRNKEKKVERKKLKIKDGH